MNKKCTTKSQKRHSLTRTLARTHAFDSISLRVVFCVARALARTRVNNVNILAVCPHARGALPIENKTIQQNETVVRVAAAAAGRCGAGCAKVARSPPRARNGG